MDDQGQVKTQRANIAQPPEGDPDYGQVQETQFEYDEFGNTVATIFADGTSTSAEYDVHARLVAQTDQLGNTTRFEHDPAGQLTAVILPTVAHPETGEPVHPRYEYSYDASGNHTLIRDNVVQHPDGTIEYDHLAAEGDDVRETILTFDSQGRQLSRTLPLGAEQAADVIDSGQDIRDELAGKPGAFTEGYTAQLN